MRFALLGDHADGLAMANALAATGRHTLAAYAGPRPGLESLEARAEGVTVAGDTEEVLADPAVEAVIVAAPLSVRAGLLRRALQSERHVLCVHPADTSPDIAYEAAMIQRDTGKVLLPLLPGSLHPALGTLAELVRASSPDRHPLVIFRHAGTAAKLTAEPATLRACVSHWEVLRRVGGEVAELFALTAGDDVRPDEPVLLSGRFEKGGLFQITLLPGGDVQALALAVQAAAGSADLTLIPAPGILRVRDMHGAEHERRWEAWDPWPAMVAAFESAVARVEARAGASMTAADPGVFPSWDDEIRALELDDAARRSIQRGRASTLEYPEATEEVGFKGTMTLVGCGLLLLILGLAILSAWSPKLGWLVIPLLLAFLALQLLRWLLPDSRAKPP